MRGFIVCFVVLGSAAIPSHSQTVTSIAGTGTSGFSGDNGPAISAALDTASAVAADAQGNIFIADTRNHRIRKISNNGTITTVAGNGQEGFSGDNGPGPSAQLSFPRGLAVDAGGSIYIADTGNSRIRKLALDGKISTIAGTGTAGFAGDGGPATGAQLNYPRGLALDASGNLYVADSWNYRVRRINRGGTIQTVAGNGSCGPFGDGGAATAASLGMIDALALDAQGNLYLSDSYQHTIRKVAGDGAISTVVGGGFGSAADGGTASTATLKYPRGLATDAQGNLLVADSLNHRVRMVVPGGGISSAAGTGVAGYSGDGGSPTAAQFNTPRGLALDSAGRLYIADLLNYRVRRATGLSAPGPTIAAVVNASGGQTPLAPGGFASIWGSNLASKTADWGNAVVDGQLPTQLGGVTVTIGGIPAYLNYVSPVQINVLVPNASLGAVQVTVSNGGSTSPPFTVTLAQYSPVLFQWGKYAVATHADFTGCGKPGLIAGYTTTPAKPGDWIVLWATGLGPTGATLGRLAPLSPTYYTAPVSATVAGLNAAVYGGAAAQSPGFAGLYQVAVQIPAGVPDGDAAVRVTVGGVQSPDNVLITVQR